MILTRKTLFMTSIAFFWSCTDSKQAYQDDNTVVIEVNIDDAIDIQNIHFIDSINITRLDNQVIFGQINKVITNSNYSFLLDAYTTQSVNIFDKKGNFVQQIANIGLGAHEYLQPTDIFIDSHDSILNLVSRIDKKVLKYSLGDFNLIKVCKMPYSFFHLQNNIQGGYVGFMNNFIAEERYNLWTMSESLEPEKYFFEIDSSWDSKSSIAIYPFSIYKDSTYYIQPLDFNVYKIDRNNISTRYYFDLGIHALPEQTKTYNEIYKLRSEPNIDYIESLCFFQETPLFLITSFIYSHQTLLSVYNKKEKKSYVTKLTPYTNQYFIPFGEIVGIDENAIYSLVEARYIKRNIIGKDEYNDFESMYPNQIKKLRDKFENIEISDEDNPFLVTHYFNVQ